MVLLSPCQEILEQMFDILRLKIMSKYDQKKYKFANMYYMQTSKLIDNVNRQIK